MRIQGHVAMGLLAAAAKVALTGDRGGLGSFLLANVLIDLDHIPSYVRRWGIVHPFDYLQLGVMGRIVAGKRSGLTLITIGPAFRPLHTSLALAAVCLVALRYPIARPIAAGMLFHRAGDWFAERGLDEIDGIREDL